MNAMGMVEHRVFLADMDITIRVLEAGAGPTVLMLHGNPDNADEWGPLIGRLSKRYRCIAPDFPGYGKSPEPPVSFTYSLADQIAFIDAILKATGVADRVILVVHDTGGMVGTAWAAANLDRLRGMVVTNTVAFQGFPWFPIARQWGDRSLFGRFRSLIGMTALGLRGRQIVQKNLCRAMP
jgi:pimeloyl-ACP methyl ester carboxylesterase